MQLIYLAPFRVGELRAKIVDALAPSRDMCGRWTETVYVRRLDLGWECHYRRCVRRPRLPAAETPGTEWLHRLTVHGLPIQTTHILAVDDGPLRHDQFGVPGSVFPPRAVVIGRGKQVMPSARGVSSRPIHWVDRLNCHDPRIDAWLEWHWYTARAGEWVPSLGRWLSRADYEAEQAAGLDMSVWHQTLRGHGP